MKTLHTFSILFWLKQANAQNGKAPLYARITVNGKRAELSLKQKLLISDWDSKKNRLKGLSDQTKKMNNYLEQVHAQLFECYQKLNRENKFVTSSLVKTHFLGENEDRYRLTDIITYHNEHMKSTLRWGTQKNYFTTHKYIFLFLKQKHSTSDMFLSELNYKFIIDFERFLRQQKAMGNNTVMKHLERLRKMVSLAFKMEWIDKDPFLKFEAKYERKERTFLSIEELEAIENKQFSVPRLQLIKDLFVFSCYTGLSYGDVMNLTKDNLCLGIDRKQWIYSQREKTRIPIKIPLLSKALQIIEKYETPRRPNTNDRLFPTISNQKLNSYLKEIADVTGIKKHLTFHIARHTFATTVTLSNGVPIETVSKLLGHSKISTTQIYAKVIERKVSEDMQKLEGLF
ncbi:site-specific integrase [Cellulophaga baltica]|uniref:site-specific integrase n=1 Tax=Cellulophaga TaxID=104264 RepID=UPI001C065814|nr:MULTISPECIES: site-specific integrase [Cellulophaga]MBU2994821.1 site-specific integrase [Cellulophaga baltica]MDO6766216.1 site-specific integrase [Cellulophaga sp. 1_MG-2023]